MHWRAVTKSSGAADTLNVAPAPLPTIGEVIALALSSVLAMSKATRILREETLYRTKPQWSHDGKRILYAIDR